MYSFPRRWLRTSIIRGATPESSGSWIGKHSSVYYQKTAQESVYPEKKIVCEAYRVVDGGKHCF